MQQLVDAAGPGFAEELELFRNVQRALSQACRDYPTFEAR